MTTSTTDKFTFSQDELLKHTRKSVEKWGTGLLEGINSETEVSHVPIA